MTIESDNLQLWKTLERRQLLDASPWFRVWREKLSLPDGKIIDDFYAIEMPDFVMIVAVDDEDRLVVERHYKHGPRRVIISLPAGYVSQNELAIDAARRELLEETGFGGGVWQELGSYVVDGNRGCGWAHFFLARNVKCLDRPDGRDLEEQQILLLSPSTFTEAIRKHEVVGLPSVCAFMLASPFLAEQINIAREMRAE